jgi:hypothetical protein
MKLPLAPFAALALLLPVSLVACSASSGTSGGSEAIGEATAAITKVPTNVACVDITIAQTADDRVIDQKFTVTPGQGAVLTFHGLPLGAVTFSGLAYPVACSSVTASTVATWATDPVAATLSPGVTANVALGFHAPGTASVGISFDDAGAWPIAISEPYVSFPSSTCGTTPPQTVSVTNTSSASVTITGAMSSPAPITLAPSALTLAAGATGSFTLTMTPPSEPVVYDETLTLTTNVAGDQPHVLSVSSQITGSMLAFVNAANVAEPTASWGSAVQGTGTFTTYLQNTGTSASTVSVVVTPSTSNADYPSTAHLEINGAAVGSAGAAITATVGGKNTIVYSFVGTTPCNEVFTYVVTVPSEANGVCTGASQTLTIVSGNGC